MPKSRRLKKLKKLDKVKIVKGQSRELFRDMPRQKRIEDKRKRPARIKLAEGWGDE